MGVTQCVFVVLALASGQAAAGTAMMETRMRQASLPSLETNCILLDACNSIEGAKVTNKTVLALNLNAVFGDCDEWAPGMTPADCATFIEYAYLSVRKDVNNEYCLTPDAFQSICNIMVKLFPSGESVVGKPPPDVLAAPEHPEMVVPRVVTAVSRMGALGGATSRLEYRGSNHEYLSICQSYPTYKATTVAYPMCARVVCATYDEMPHDRKTAMDACCRSYSGELGYWWEKYCWYLPDEASSVV